MHPILVDLGFIRIHTYGFCISLGVVFAIYLAIRLGRVYNVSQDFILDLSIKLLISGIIGSKVLYLLVYFRDYLDDPVRIITEFRSGFVFLGGLILAFYAGYRHVKKSRYDIKVLFDVFAPAIPLAHAFGRLGCTMAGCCYGKVAEYDAFYTLRFCHPETAAYPRCRPLIATQPISSIFLFLLSLFIVFLFYKWKKRPPGTLLYVYAMNYSVFRFTIEFFRGDYRGGILFFSTSQILCLIIFPSVLYLLLRSIKKKKQDE